MKTFWTMAVAVLLAAPARPLGAQGGWRPLFNGKSLDGWSACNGTAPFSVEDGTITGRTVVKSPNSFLCTKETFGDFILEYEAWAATNLNSGVQIRSTSDPAIKGGRVHGYQVEIDPSDRAWSGGIYDEARRGWLHTLVDQEAARKAFHLGQWNRFRVEAIGTSIRTWLNGVPCANIIDDLTPRGIIALQVHAIGNDQARAGEIIRFRNLRILTENLQANRTPDRGDTPQYNYIPNTISEREAREGWKLLWDGKTTAGWRGARLDRFPQGGWEIRDGELTVLESGGREANAGGDIVTMDQYGDFELIVEYKITKGANSGIKYFVNTDLNKGEGSAIGCEFQILDDAEHPDAKAGVNGNRKNAGLYDLIPPQNVRFNGVGEWNRARIVVRGRHVEHWLNLFKTVEYERGTQMWRALVDHSKYVVWPNFGEAPKGHILLQDHGNRVSFRSIKIRELK
jgi:3-keto-disaccharide hydrolase